MQQQKHLPWMGQTWQWLHVTPRWGAEHWTSSLCVEGEWNWEHNSWAGGGWGVRSSEVSWCNRTLSMIGGRSWVLVNLVGSEVLPAEWAMDAVVAAIAAVLVLGPYFHTLDVYVVPTAKLAECEGQGFPPQQPFLADGTDIISVNWFGRGLATWFIKGA